MPFIKVTYSSPSNIGVQGSDYFEVPEEELNEDGSVPQHVLTDAWQEAVNEYMGDTSAKVVENEGD